MNYVLDDQAKHGLNLFSRSLALGLVPGEMGPSMMDNYEGLYQLRRMGVLDDFIRANHRPTDNSSWEYNDNEYRYLPPTVVPDSSYYWINH